MSRHEIQAEDILPIERYTQERSEHQKKIIEIKKQRRVAVGPFCHWHFENYETMLYQIQEMLWIERGGEEQIRNELDAYNPLVPKGKNLSATVMFEIEEKLEREFFLKTIGGIEHTAYIQFPGVLIQGTALSDLERSTSEGRASAVQFILFSFDDDTIRKFKKAKQIYIGFNHPAYAYSNELTSAVHSELVRDFS